MGGIAPRVRVVQMVVKVQVMVVGVMQVVEGDVSDVVYEWRRLLARDATMAVTYICGRHNYQN